MSALKFCLVAASLFFFRMEAARPDSSLKEQLLREYGIQALDETDEHAPQVLRNFLFLLRNSLSPSFIQGLGNFQYLFAYAGHDRLYDSGAFHVNAKAISVGGKSAYPPGTESGGQSIEIISTLAHELGHAFLLEKISPAELRDISEKYGGWGELFKAGAVSPEPITHLSSVFFSPHPKFSSAQNFPGPAAAGEWKRINLSSRLAAKNIHEWFADAFAATVLQRLGAAGRLGANWRERLRKNPKQKREYWTDYNLVAAEFSSWLWQKIDTVSRPSGLVSPAGRSARSEL